MHSVSTDRSSRRSFLRGAALGAAALSGFGALSPVTRAAAAPKVALSVDDIVSLTPVECARRSVVVQTAWEQLLASAGRLRDVAVRTAVLDILRNPDTKLDLSREAEIVRTLHAEGLLDAKSGSVFPENGQEGKAPQPTWSAPGSGYGSHHAYPGGLVVHVALNVLSAEKLLASYSDNNVCDLSATDAVGGELLHDLHKPWVFQWLADNSSRKERTLAATGEHHVLSVAESIRRGLPTSLVVAQACAHEHPGSSAGEAQVVGWLRAAAIIAGVDPVKAGLLAADGRTLPLPRRTEGFVVHLADHDWVISVPACQWTVKALAELAKRRWGVDAEKSPKEFNAIRNWVLANLTAMRLHAIRSSEGDEAFARDVTRVIKA